MKKMRSLVVALITGISLAAPLQAQIQLDTPYKYRRQGLSLWGGYTTADMADVNRAVKSLSSGGSVTEINNGYMFAADYLYEVMPRFSIGPRVEYIYLNMGKASSSTLLTYKQFLYLVPIMAGGRYAFVNNDRWKLSAGLFLGVGLGYGDTKIITSAAPGVETETKYDGSGFIGDLLFGGQYALGENTYAGIDVGYRSGKIDKMTVSNTMSSTVGGSGSDGGGGGLYAPDNRAVVQDPSGKELTYDFSGLSVTIGLIFRF